MKIAFFTDTFFPQVNGVSRTMERQIQYLKKKGDEIIIFAPEYKEGDSPSEYGRVEKFKSIKVFFYPECRLSMTLTRRIRQSIKRFQPDLIHIVTEFTLGIAGIMIGRQLGIPMVSTFHTDYDKYMDYYKMRGLKPLAWSILRREHNSCVLTFCPSAETSKLLVKNGIRKVKVLSNGVDTEMFYPGRRNSELRKTLGNQDKLMILYVGRVAMEKDINILISAFHKIKPVYGDKISLVITGDGPVKNKLEKETGHEIIFTGYKKGTELAEMYASADIFAYPSTTETFGNVVVEAMACALPVVAAASGGVMDSVIDDYNGVLTEPKNPDSFAEGLIRLIDDSELREVYSKNALDFALKKSWDVILKDMYTTFEDIISHASD